jgi:hypothetical protein
MFQHIKDKAENKKIKSKKKKTCVFGCRWCLVNIIKHLDQFKSKNEIK